MMRTILKKKDKWFLLVVFLVAILLLPKKAEAGYFASAQLVLSPNSETVEVGKEIKVSVVMKAGTAKISGVNVKLKYDGDVFEVKEATLSDVFNAPVKQDVSGGVVNLVGLSTKTSSQLPTGDFTVGQFKLLAKKTGTAMFSLADDYEVTGVSSTADNNIKLTFEGAKYTAVISGVTVTPTPSGGSKADLVIDKITIERLGPPQMPVESYRYSVYVKNIGIKNAPKSSLKTQVSPSQPQCVDGCTKVVEYSGSLAPIPMNDWVKTDYLPPGATERYFDYFNPKVSGKVSIIAVADFYGVVDELDESNNTKTETFEVQPVLIPTLAPTSVISQPMVFFQPETGAMEVNESMDSTLWLNTNKIRVSGVSFKVNFDATKVEVNELKAGGVFDSQLEAKVDNTRGQIVLKLLSMKPADKLPSGMIKLADFKIKGKTEGQVTFSIGRDYEVSSPDTSGNVYLVLRSAGYQVTGGGVTSPHFYFEKKSKEQYKVGGVYSAVIGADSGKEKITAMDILGKFDSSMIEIVTIKKVLEPAFKFEFSANTAIIHNDTGKLELTLAPDRSTSYNGALVKGLLLEVVFKVKKEGLSKIDFICLNGGMTECNMINQASQDVIVCLANKSLEINTSGLPSIKCGWCGKECVDLSTKRACLDVMPPEGQVCTLVDGKCEIRGTGVITPTPVPSTCKQCQGGVLGKNKGNASKADGKCDTKVDLSDFETWRREAFDENGLKDSDKKIKKSNWSADFDCDQMVTMFDFGIWSDTCYGVGGSCRLN